MAQSVSLPYFTWYLAFLDQVWWFPRRYLQFITCLITYRSMYSSSFWVQVQFCSLVPQGCFIVSRVLWCVYWALSRWKKSSNNHAPPTRPSRNLLRGHMGSYHLFRAKCSLCAHIFFVQDAEHTLSRYGLLYVLYIPLLPLPSAASPFLSGRRMEHGVFLGISALHCLGCTF